MHVTHLSLADFRSYARVEVPLDPGVTAFVGANGQGKTNLVEAIGYLATLGSHRVSSDAPLVRMGADRAVIRAAVTQGERSQLIELELNPGKANRARINRSSQVRPRDVLGIVRTVLFAPEDLALVKGDPGERRMVPRRAGHRAVAADGRGAIRLRAGAETAQHAAEVRGDGAPATADGPWTCRRSTCGTSIWAGWVPNCWRSGWI